MKTLLIISALGAASLSNAALLFYGGDFDGRNGFLAQTTTGFDGINYDDFNLTSAMTITSLFGNFQIETAVVATTTNWEIRSGMSANNPGTLHASGTTTHSLISTGRVAFGDPEFQVTVSGLSVSLGAGTYFMSMSMNNTGGGATWISTTSGLDVVTGGDPNPLPTGSPLANGNSFFSSTAFSFNVEPTSNVFGPGTWDLSYGVNGVVPEPGTFIVIGLGLAALALRRRK